MLNSLKQFGLLAHTESTIVTHHSAEELNTKLTMHAAQIPAKTQVSFVCYIKTSLLKTSNSSSNKNLLIKPNSSYQIIGTF